MNDLLCTGVSSLLPMFAGISTRDKLSILVYHRILEQQDYLRPGVPVVEEFDWQMALLARYFNPISLSQAAEALKENRLPDRAVCVTFDDGYADNLTLGLPVLKKWGVPATVFVSTGFMNGGRMWNDTIIESFRCASADSFSMEDLSMQNLPLRTRGERYAACEQTIKAVKHLAPVEREALVSRIATLVEGQLPTDLMLSTEQLTALHQNGVEIGAHTVNHPILAVLGDQEARDEIAKSRQQLESICQAEIKCFAYPNGVPGQDFLPRHRDIIEALGFEAAVTTTWGVSSHSTDPWLMPRFTPWDRTPHRFLVRLFLNMRKPDQDTGFKLAANALH